MKTQTRETPWNKRICRMLLSVAAVFLLQSPALAQAGGMAETFSSSSPYASSAMVEEVALKDAVIEAQLVVSEAQNKVEETQATVDKGSLGFFEWVGADAALDALRDSKYASMTHQGDCEDATTLEHMKESLEWLEEFNELRARLGLSQLSVSYESMAQAQADANYSDTVVAHSRQFDSTAENLAWNYGPNTWGGVVDPYVQWYDNEKAAYDGGNRNSQEIGHYLNIINQDYDNTGFALCTRGTMHGWNTYSQTFNTGRGDTLSLSEFKAQFDKYYNKYVGEPQRLLDEAQSKLEAAEDNFAAGIIRVGGADRYQTMNSLIGGNDGKLETTFDTYSQTGDIVVVSGNDFADALSASALAGICKTGIITADKDGLDSGTLSVLQKAGITHVAYIVGGEKAVSPLVEGQLEELGYRVVRISGEDRYETAAAVYNQTIALKGKSSTVIIASGANYADALSIAPYAYAQGIPFFLTGPEGELNEEAKIFFTSNNLDFETVILVGGEQVVSAATQKTLETEDYQVIRLAGLDRYETNETINNWLDANSPTNSYAGKAVYAVDGEGFADALAVAPIAGIEGATVALAKSSNVSVAKHAMSQGALPIAVGGLSAITNDTLRAIAKM